MPEDYLKKASLYFNDETIAIICPLYWDINAYSREAFERTKPSADVSFVDRCISSGSLVRVSCLKKLGGFDESMFIDYVDYDYCRTVIENDLKIIQLNTCVMKHQIGKSKIVYLLGRQQIIHNHSGLRKFYFFRNRVYYARKHHLKVMENKGFYVGFIKLLVLVFYEEHAFSKFGMSIKGIFAGLRMPIRRSKRKLRK